MHAALHSVLSPLVQSFIRQHEQDDVTALALKFKAIENVPISVVIDQINGRRKAKDKLPSYYNNDNVIYPPALNLEQSSSEITGTFKSDFLKKHLEQTKSCADLTGGFGVDSFFFSKTFNAVQYIERNSDLLQIAKHNHKALGSDGIKHRVSDAEIYLAESNDFLDCIFIDPSRRNQDNKKVFSFASCEPDVTTLLPNIFSRTGSLFIKASPLLDIDKGISELRGVVRVVVLAVANECKELLFLCASSGNSQIQIDAVNIKRNGVAESFSFTPDEERSATSEFSEPKTFLYEPNAAILKAGAFKTIGSSFKISKVHINTHLYTADERIENFPGRIFRILGHVKGDQKELQQYFPSGQANISTRNYPLSVAELRRKTKLSDGGAVFLIGFTGPKKKYLVAAERVV